MFSLSNLLQMKRLKNKMSHSSLLTIFSLSSFFLVAPNANHTLVNAQSLVDLVNTTCKCCAERSPVIDHAFCLTSLQSIPASKVPDLQGLAFAAIDLALEDATATVSAIEEMIHIREFDPFAMNCLKDCRELYTDGALLLVNTVGVIISGQYDVANIHLSAVMESTTTCEQGFEEKDGEFCPLTKENYNVYQLSDIALCITKLLSEDSASMSS